MSKYRAEFWDSPNESARCIGSATYDATTCSDAWKRAEVLARRSGAKDFNLIDIDRGNRFIGSVEDCNGIPAR